MLRLVLRQHGVHEAPGQQRVVVREHGGRDRRQRVPPRVVEVAQAVGVLEEGQPAAARARMRDRVVEVIAPARLVVAPAARVVRPPHPLLLEVGDVSEVPHDRAHERAVLPGELSLRERARPARACGCAPW